MGQYKVIDLVGQVFGCLTVGWQKLFVNLSSSCITDFVERGYTEKALDSFRQLGGFIMSSFGKKESTARCSMTRAKSWCSDVDRGVGHCNLDKSCWSCLYRFILAGCIRTVTTLIMKEWMRKCL